MSRTLATFNQIQNMHIITDVENDKVEQIREIAPTICRDIENRIKLADLLSRMFSESPIFLEYNDKTEEWELCFKDEDGFDIILLKGKGKEEADLLIAAIQEE